MDDRELLNEYITRHSHDAFRRLVERHLPMVYSTARRIASDSDLAEEIAQNVFTTLAQKAESIRPPQIIGGWLYNTTRFFAMHAVRGEQRRREREQTAALMQALESSGDESRITEHLEPAMAELDADDRDVLVLRFLENRSLREVGAELGISEDAARMRVNRALERLRAAFDRKEIAVTTALLATALTASTGAVPAGLSVAVASAALSGATSLMATQATAVTVNWLNAKAVAAILSSAIIASVGTYLAVRQKNDRLQADVRAATAIQERLTTARDQALAAVKAGGEEVKSLRKQVQELPRLRGEVTRLRRELQDSERLRSARDQGAGEVLHVAGIIISNIGPRAVSDEQVRKGLRIKVGDSYSRPAIDDEVRNLYGSGLFSNVRISGERTNGSVILTYFLQSKAMPTEPGKYIAKERLAFVGTATPEAALESITWLMFYGDYDKLNATALSPDMLESELKDPKNREGFESRQKVMEPLFKGMQILARKTLSEQRVELKINYDVDPFEGKRAPSIRAKFFESLSGWDWKGNIRARHGPDFLLP